MKFKHWEFKAVYENGEEVMKFIILGAITFLVSTAFSKNYLTVDQAKDWFDKNKDRCVFAAVRTYRGKTKTDQKVLSMIGAKPNDIEQYTNPYARTPSLCIFDGTMGKGAATKTGCILGRYLLDHDSYESIRYYRNMQFADAMIPGKCDKNTIQSFLLKYKFDDFVLIGFRPSDSDVWKNFNDGPEALETDIHILIDQFNVKADLDQILKQGKK